MIKKYRVQVTQINVFFIDAKNEAEAEKEAVEGRIWDEDQSSPDYYTSGIEVEEVK